MLVLQYSAVQLTLGVSLERHTCWACLVEVSIVVPVNALHDISFAHKNISAYMRRRAAQQHQDDLGQSHSALEH